MYNLDVSYSGTTNKEGCSSAGVAIAPIPSSVLSVESKYNQTYTGIISGANSASTRLPGSSAATTTGSFPLTFPDSTAHSTPNQGIASITTLDGGGQGMPTEVPSSNNGGLGELPSATTSSIPKLSSGNQAAQGRNSGVAIKFSFVAFGISVLYLIY